MKRSLSIALCLFLLLSCAIPALAANDVPEEVMEATKSVVRILSQYYNGAATGSGFVIKNEPGEVLIATNNHVVEDNPTSISVWVAEDELVEAEIVFTTAKKDLCVLKITDPVDMEPLTLSKEDPRQGQAVYAVGYPGVGDVLSDSAAHTSEAATITDGIISAIRIYTIEEGADPAKLLQINAAINPGNSGGPLFNAKGEVIGVNTYKVNKESQGIFGAVDISELWTLLRRNGIEIPEKETEQATEAVAETKTFLVWIAIGVAGAVVLAVVVVLLVSRKKKQPKRKNRKQAVTLREHLQNYPQGLGIGGAVSLLLPAGIALRNLHNDGKLHLEICPENILIGPGGVSLKNPSGQEAGWYNSGYAAPEIYKAAGYGITSDIYSFAAVLYFAATGKAPANSLQQDMLEKDFDVLEDAAFVQVLRKSMAFSVLDRTQSMQELIYGIAVFNVPEEAPKAAAQYVAEEVTAAVEEIPAPVAIVPAPAAEVPAAASMAEMLKERHVAVQKVQPTKNTKKRIRILLLLGAVLACAAVAAGVLLWKSVIVPEQAYKQAVELMEAGQYEEAIAAFEAMDGYEDSSQRIEDCETAILELRYEAAVSLMQQGKYEEAIAAFEALEGYRDSVEKAEEIVRMTAYAAAEDLLASGDHYGAATAFGAMGDYRDARDRSFALWEEIVHRETVSAGLDHNVALKTDGTVVAGGWNDFGQCNVSDWRDCAAISAGGFHTAGLKTDGTVVAVGCNDYGQCDVSSWRDIVAISAGYRHTIGLKTDGTVVAVGDNDYGQCDVSGWTDIVAISAGYRHTIGLKTDGTVVAVGDNEYGRCDVSGWTDIVAIRAGGSHTLGLKSDGTVVAVGDNKYGQCNVSSWQDCVAISAGYSHTVGLKSDGTVVVVKSNAYSSWRNCVAISAGQYHTLGLKADGTVMAIGDNEYGQCDVSGWTDIKLLSTYLALPAYMGVSVMNTDQSSSFAGAFVFRLIQDCAAQRAGIQLNDIIIRLGDYEISNTSDLANAISNFKAGDVTTVTVVRNDQELQLQITFDVKP